MRARALGCGLADVNAAGTPQDLSLPTYRLHQLKADRKGHWSIWIPHFDVAAMDSGAAIHLGGAVTV